MGGAYVWRCKDGKTRGVVAIAMNKMLRAANAHSYMYIIESAARNGVAHVSALGGRERGGGRARQGATGGGGDQGPRHTLPIPLEKMNSEQ
mmetsp:Transcript_3143/g.6762  ORF Transcript_3143/g.6762 Transcript_3143/m.6762 type:complete len:91 (-) Transcript_3143:1325-1597(-)